MLKLSIGEVKEVLDSFRELLGFENSRDFTDIKKRAKENELTLYTLISDNVPSEIYARVKLLRTIKMF